MLQKMDLSFPTLDELTGKKTAEEKTAPVVTPVVTAIPVAETPTTTRVAAYCRVSTLFSGQDESFEIQQKHFNREINEHPGWDLVGLYCDRESATHMDNRPQLQLLLDACKKKQVDLVLTKSVSRFSRSTTDFLWMVRTIISSGAAIYFHEDGVQADGSNSELMLSLLASFAESEVRSFSDNNKWAIRKRFENGTYKYATVPYGYELIDGQVVVHWQEAEIVREIFNMYLNGKGCNRIAKELNARGIPPKRVGDNWQKQSHSGEWDPAVIHKMLRNDFYIGSSLLQKTFTDQDFRIRPNKGECAMFFLEQHHPAIIDKPTFEKAQALAAQFAAGDTGKQIYPFTGKCFCGQCGSSLNRNAKSEKRGYWTCRKHRRDSGKCGLQPVLEEDLENAFVTMMNKLHYADVILDIYENEITKEWNAVHGEKRATLQQELAENEAELNRLVVRKGKAAAYWERRNQIMIKIMRLKEDLAALEMPALGELKQMRDFVKNWEGEFSADVLNALVERITVETADTFIFHFKCGLELRE